LQQRGEEGTEPFSTDIGRSQEGTDYQADDSYSEKRSEDLVAEPDNAHPGRRSGGEI